MLRSPSRWGAAFGDKANIALVEELARAMGAALSCSRPIADAKWLDKARQVGSVWSCRGAPEKDQTIFTAHFGKGLRVVDFPQAGPPTLH